MSTIKDKYSKLLKDKKDNLANVKKTNTSNKVSTVSKKEIVDISIPETTVKDKSRKATLDGKKIIIKFNYDAELVAQIKNLDGRKYILDGKYWTCTCTLNNINSLVTLNFNLDSKLKIKHEQLIKIVTKRNTPKKYNTDNIKVPKGLSLMEFQKEGVGFIESRNGNVIVGDEMGTGKAQSLDSKILTPKGWIRMGDIKINDTVIDSNGKLTKVIGVYPQGKKSVYKVTFSDGSSTECCDEHLWCLTTTNSRKRKPNSVSIKQLSEFKDDLFKYDKNNKITGRKWFIPIVKPIDFENNVDLLIHPYLLGIILAEGGISTKAIHITTSEENIINYCETLLPETLLINKIKNTKYDYRIVQKDINKNCNILTRNLRHYNLMGTNSHTKFIPEDYLFSSIENRILLLQGLMDGDGCGNTLNSCGYVTASNALYLGIKFLIESLGGVLNNPKQVYKKIKDKTYGPFWYFSFRLPKDIKPFLNSNKKNIYSSQHKYVPYRAFDKVEYIGEKECQCICVDSPTHTYLTDDCIVTHNTITVLTYISNHPELTPVVIVVPATLKYNWKKEADKWLLTKRDIQILEGKKTKKLKKSSDIIIVNYDIVHAWRKEIANINPKVLVLDECHDIKTSTTKRTKGVKHIAKKTKHIIPMSGTPAINRPAELYNSIKLVEPELFGSFQSYAQRYCDAYFNGYGWEYKGGSNLEELYDILSNIMIRRKKEDVIEDLPEKRRTFVSLDLTNISDYNKAENDFIEWVRENKGKRAADRASSAEKLVKVGTLRLLAVRGALANSIQWIKNFLDDYDGKLVVFAVHKEIISALMEEFGDIAVKIDGSVANGEIRQTIVEKFQNDKNIRLFVGNIKAAGVGITLTASSNIVFLELPWTPGELEQAEDRCHRMGQKNAVNIWYLLAENTIEMELAKMIDSKRNILSQVLDGQVISEEDTLSSLLGLYEGKGL